MTIIIFILNPEKKSYRKERERKEEDRIDLNLEKKKGEMEFKTTRSVTLNFTFILTFNYISLILTLETDPKLQRNILKFGYGINYKYDGSYPILLIDIM